TSCRRGTWMGCAGGWISVTPSERRATQPVCQGCRVADRALTFLKEYEIINEGQPGRRWVEGHGIPLRIHLLPFFGELGVSEVTPGKVRITVVHRATTPSRLTCARRCRAKISRPSTSRRREAPFTTRS
ncbi:MAG: hypothetical protein ABSA58_09335, partial [Acetobacteraceae bacterium]